MNINLLKLWDKGIDITANVITSVIVALIGLAFWRVKLWLDLRAEEQKQRQQHRIKVELDEEQRWADSVEHDREVRAVFASYGESAAQLLDAEGMAMLWDLYIGWLRHANLDKIPPNMYTIAQLAGWSEEIRNTTPANLDQVRRTLRKRIEDTAIPELQRTAQRPTGPTSQREG